jgi:hypothetical protein
MNVRPVIAALIAAAAVWGAPPPLGAQCNPDCQGDFNDDREVTIDELVAAVANALDGCAPSPAQGCVASGGSVATASCCASAPEFPDTCAIGPCGCSPQASRELSLCECGDGRCFDRDQRRCVPRQ